MYALRISSCWLIGYSQIWGLLLGSLIKWAISILVGGGSLVNVVSW
jgi:hypothetical protein